MIKKFFNKPIIVISFICYVILTVLIFSFSLTSGEESSSQSAFVWSFISSILNVNGNYEYLIRKLLGHFLLFSALGVSASVVYFRLSQLIFKNHIELYSTLIILLIGIITASISELLQLNIFVQGRSASFFDLLIDFLGYIVGYILYIIIKTIYLYIIEKKNYL